MPNFLISRWRRKQKSAGATWLNANGDLVLGISWIVKAEFLCGAEIAGHDREAINHFLMRFPTVWPVHETLEVYASLYAALKKRNQLIGRHDLRIAACALQKSVPLFSKNKMESGRLPGLALES